MFFTRAELVDLNRSHINTTYEETMSANHEELRSYMEIAHTMLAPLKEINAPIEEVIRVLSNVKYGENGYIFGYLSNGDRVLLGQSDKGLGNNYWNLKDVNNFPLIQDIVQKAKSGGGYTTYYFPKPGEEKASPKLAYSIYEKEWDLVIGTGFYIDDVDKHMAEMEVAAGEQVDSALFSIGLSSIIILILAGGLAITVNQSIIRPLSVFDKSIEAFSSGDADLTSRMDSYKIPEFNRLSTNFNKFVEKLQDIIKNVGQVSTEVVSETSDMAQRAVQVDALANQQHEETDQVATAMTEMTTTAVEISNNALQAAESAKQAEDNTSEAMDIVSTAASSVEALAGDVQQANEVISKLESDVQNISSSLEVIQDIAEQTNLLALNAAIEAARAGEQGRGFAVVADEVRKLASRTQESTLEIHEMINKLKAASDAAVQTMDKSQGRSLDTVKEANAAAQALNKIQESINTIMEMNSLIATATEEQNQVGQEISERVVVISDKSSQSAQLASKNQAGSKQLNAKSLELSDLVSRFNV